MRSFIKYLFMAALLITALPSPLRAEVKPLRYNLNLDLAVTAVSAIGWLGMSIAQNKLAPANCRWCQVDSFDKWGHDNLKWSNAGAANTISNVTGYALAPLVAFGLDAIAAHEDDAMSGFWPDTLVIAEAAAAASFFTQIIKISAGRERPNAYFGGGAANRDDNLSFYSAHTALAFSLAVSSGTVATMRGYTLAPWIWGSGLGVAALTGYLRVASDSHYLTDVITGAGVGAAFGFGLPYLLHRPTDTKDKKMDRLAFFAAPLDQGGVLSVSGAW